MDTAGDVVPQLTTPGTGAARPTDTFLTVGTPDPKGTLRPTVLGTLTLGEGGPVGGPGLII